MVQISWGFWHNLTMSRRKTSASPKTLTDGWNAFKKIEFPSTAKTDTTKLFSTVYTDNIESRASVQITKPLKPHASPKMFTTGDMNAGTYMPTKLIWFPTFANPAEKGLTNIWTETLSQPESHLIFALKKSLKTWVLLLKTTIFLRTCQKNLPKVKSLKKPKRYSIQWKLKKTTQKRSQSKKKEWDKKNKWNKIPPYFRRRHYHTSIPRPLAKENLFEREKLSRENLENLKRFLRWRMRRIRWISDDLLRIPEGMRKKAWTNDLESLWNSIFLNAEDLFL